MEEHQGGRCIEFISKCTFVFKVSSMYVSCNTGIIERGTPENSQKTSLYLVVGLKNISKSLRRCTGLETDYIYVFKGSMRIFMTIGMSFPRLDRWPVWMSSATFVACGASSQQLGYVLRLGAL